MLDLIETEVLSRFEEVCVSGAGSEEVALVVVELKDAVKREREAALKQNFASVRKQALDLKEQCVQQAKVRVWSLPSENLALTNSFVTVA